MTEGRHRQSWQLRVGEQETGDVVSYLCRHTGISKRKLKEAMTKGAVWLRRGRGKRKRLRRATTRLQAGDEVALHYDSELLQRTPPTATKLWQHREYSLWFKPPGLLSQGNEYGDHVSLLRQAELTYPSRKTAYLVHRLDREACGLMLIAHTQKAASSLSRLFQTQQVNKVYQVRVVGRPSRVQAELRQPLDGKPALTHYELLAYDAKSDTSELRVWIETGRTHQIRRHLAMLGHPVMGDPKYGRGNKTPDGLQLRAIRLAFICPLTQEKREFDLASFWPD